MALKLVVHNNGTEEDAKDVFQEAVIVLYDKVQEGSFELQSKLKTFLYAVCRRLWLKRLQLQQRHTFLAEEIDELIPVEQELAIHEEKDQQFVMMEEALAGIGEPCRAILEAYYLHKRSMQEIAEKFGYTNAENAKNQKYKCLLRLKKLFFAQYKHNHL